MFIYFLEMEAILNNSCIEALSFSIIIIVSLKTNQLFLSCWALFLFLFRMLLIIRDGFYLLKYAKEIIVAKNIIIEAVVS